MLYLQYFVDVMITNLLISGFVASQSLKKGGYKEMLKKDLVTKVAAVGLSKKMAALAVDAVFEAITDSLKAGDPVLLTGFGKFEVRTRAARTGINPKTLAKIQLPASKVPAFKAGKALKAAVK
jgi:DNA-binding protein HU-beta